jgi:segregation and condensation protein A
LSGIITAMGTSQLFHHVDPYQVSTPIYEGPLDLLLQLIERAELDITRLALAQVTDQFLEHLRLFENRSAEQVSAFLVVAARLLQIKSEAILPRPPVRESGEEDPAEALAMQLIAYKRYRQIAELLARREESGLHTFLRLAPAPRIEANIDLSGIGIDELVSSAHTMFLQVQQQQMLSTVVSLPRITIREKIQYIAKIIRSQRFSTFTNLLSNKNSRLDIVVTFLALLELIKRKLVKAQQERLFSEIALEPVENWQYDSEIETEFGE